MNTLLLAKVRIVMVQKVLLLGSGSVLSDCVEDVSAFLFVTVLMVTIFVTSELLITPEPATVSYHVISGITAH